MNERIIELAEKAGFIYEGESKFCVFDVETKTATDCTNQLNQFFELIKQSIWDDVKEELLEDENINIETDPFVREYLKGCNGGTVDALYRIKQFGVEE